MGDTSDDHVSILLVVVLASTGVWLFMSPEAAEGAQVVAAVAAVFITYLHFVRPRLRRRRGNAGRDLSRTGNGET